MSNWLITSHLQLLKACLDRPRTISMDPTYRIGSTFYLFIYFISAVDKEKTKSRVIQLTEHVMLDDGWMDNVVVEDGMESASYLVLLLAHTWTLYKTSIANFPHTDCK